LDATQGYLYFLQGHSTRAVKIGFSNDPPRRLMEVQRYSAECLRLVAARCALSCEEQDAHFVFRRSHLHHEWFRPTKEVLACVERGGILPPHARHRPPRDIDGLLKEATKQDPQGRRIKRFLGKRGLWMGLDGTETRHYLWDDPLTCLGCFAFMVIYDLLRRRRQKRSMWKLLRTTVDSANDNNPNLANNPIQLSWDFSKEVEGNDNDAGDPKKPR
jgi:hypothetical protein